MFLHHTKIEKQDHKVPSFAAGRPITIAGRLQFKSLLRNSPPFEKPFTSGIDDLYTSSVLFLQDQKKKIEKLLSSTHSFLTQSLK